MSEGVFTNPDLDFKTHKCKYFKYKMKDDFKYQAKL